VHGPLELEIPIQTLETPGEMIHQLAAKKATTELEQGRGWLSVARNESGRLLKEVYPGQFEDMVEREAVRVGVQYQVGGKWCSFVAVDKTKQIPAQKEKDAYEWLDVSNETHETTPRTTVSRKSTFRTKYQFEDDSADEEEDMEEEECATLHSAAARLNSLGRAMGAEVDAQNSQILRYHAKTDRVDDHIALNTARLDRIDKRSSPQMSAPGGGDSQRQLFAQISSTVLERGEPNWTLSQSSRGLSDQAKMFYSNAKKSRSPFGGLFSSGGLFGDRARSAATPPPPPPPAPRASTQSMGTSSPAFSLSGSSSAASVSLRAPPSSSYGGEFVSVAAALAPPEVDVDEATLEQYQKEMAHAACMPLPDEEEDADLAAASLQAQPAQTDLTSAAFMRRSAYLSNPHAAPSPSASPFGLSKSGKTDDDILQELIGLQTFEGYWEWSPALFQLIKVPEEKAQKSTSGAPLEKRVLATALTIAFFESKLGAYIGSWELVVDKAREWLGGKAEEVVAQAKGLL
jgi:hypothetical protein